VSSELDKALEEIQRALYEGYSDTVIDHAQNPRNLGRIDEPDGFASVLGECGDTMQVWLKVRDNTIREIKFLTDGCGTSIAAGSMATEMVKGKTIVEAARITRKDVLDALGGLPEESEHCALLAANTIKAAVRDYLAYKKEPWKRAYRRYY
jgi:nitrogen fixation NifU-like protein